MTDYMLSGNLMLRTLNQNVRNSEYSSIGRPTHWRSA